MWNIETELVLRLRKSIRVVREMAHHIEYSVVESIPKSAATIFIPIHREIEFALSEPMENDGKLHLASLAWIEA